jgi:hypothetical protein
MFTKEDEKEFNTKWTFQPCKRNDARITQFTFPHGSDSSVTGIRRTMLPWFVKVHDDHSSFEIFESGTWEAFSEAYRDFKAPLSTSSGLSNRYGAILYRFPAVMEITGISPLSDTLIC